ncbi:NGG1p interacting factor 3 [Rhizodiscina lignyota]|uniref:NGG1p interacting factor 3 n=1 Tax=Rhizodiscina lignyota TaxID=1504668 RepID=A0A9P4MBK4_9PEZI|nr:NGG1p interacting factor 3 [Rhizodiscina lignyota]
MFPFTLRRTFTMSASLSIAPFSGAVVAAMRKLYPEALADKSWDNTGLLLEAPFNPRRRQKNSVLLTVDLTKAVADEAIERRDSIVVAYHPIIFRGLKSITLADTQQQSLLRLAAEGISVYSPHTAIDAASGGLGDWLADIVTGELATAAEDAVAADGEPVRLSSRARPTTRGNSSSDDTFKPPKKPVYIVQHHPSQLDVPDADLKLASTSHTRVAIKALDFPDHPGAGMGRIVRFTDPQRLTDIIERIGRGLGNPKGFPIAVPQGSSIDDITISSVGICAGSGGSLFKDLDVDLLFTGELSHHEALAAIEKGQCVICLFHSNTERGYLHSVLMEKLEASVKEEWRSRRVRMKEDQTQGLADALQDDEVTVSVSERDRDPYGVLISKTELGE